MRRLTIPLQGAQMLFVAFGALVLMPLLTGLDTSVALFTAGIGTLLFQLITKRQVPIFLASSFAFIAPILYGVQTWGYHPPWVGSWQQVSFMYCSVHLSKYVVPTLSISYYRQWWLVL